MKKFTFPGRKRAVIVAATLLASLTLVACGSGGDSFHAADVPAPAPVPMLDTFFAAVSGLMATSPEDTEPSATVEAIVATAPEDTEPQPIS